LSAAKPIERRTGLFAKATGLTIPESFLVRADEVID
jgi:hypothetical protein